MQPVEEAEGFKRCLLEVRLAIERNIVHKSIQSTHLNTRVLEPFDQVSHLLIDRQISSHHLAARAPVTMRSLLEKAFSFIDGRADMDKT